MRRSLSALLAVVLLLLLLPTGAAALDGPVRIEEPDGVVEVIEEAPEADAGPDVSVRLSGDLRSAEVTGDYAGLYARAALVLDNGGVTGLYVTQADIGPAGVIAVPELEIPGLTVTGVSIALVRSLADISAAAPRTEAMDFRLAASPTPTPVPVPASTPSPVPVSTPAPLPASRARQLLAGMTLREKICQMMIVRPTDLEPWTIRTVEPEMEAALARYPVGGLLYNTVNMRSRDQVRKLLADTQAFSAIPLLTMCDEEGGTVARLMRTVGTTWVGSMLGYKDMGPDTAYENALTIGSDMAALGFSLDLAPVADVWSNPSNTVIGSRAYSDDFAQAAELIPAAVAGFHDGGVACTLKHFPGHGDTSEDTHYGSAYVYKTLDELRTHEFLPFRAGIEAGADCVMLGHIIAAEISDEPALFSHVLVTGILRGELGFEGVVMTDALEMQALSNHYGTAEIAVRAVSAGVDMLLCPADLRGAVNALVAAVEAGEISEARIDESVLRILTLKENRGLI